MLADNKYVKTFVTIGSITTALASIIGAWFIFFPKVTSQAVEISDVRLQHATGPASPSGGCESQVIVSFKMKIDGYRDRPVKLYSKLDDSAASPLPNNGLPCPQPLGAWDGWQYAKDVKAAVQTQTLQVAFPVTVYFRKENRTIQLRATDANEQVLATAVSPVFSSK